jgi:transketolase
LGAEEIKLTREALGWSDEAFVIPQDIYAAWNANEKGQTSEAAWNDVFAAYQAKYPTEAAELLRRVNGVLPADFTAQADAFIAQVNEKAETIATRKASQNTLQAFGPLLPEMLGGSADLAGSNLTLWKGCEGVQDNPAGNYVYYGVREFGMTAIANGVALHGGFVPYVATFLMFMEYARNAVRMSALMKQRVIHVYTHDSIGLGEDGPTHQPIEQIASLRGTPNLNTWRPADTVETAIAWKSALERKDGPTALILSRQNLPFQSRTEAQIQDAAKGGYVLAKEKGELKAIIIATGSEVSIAMDAYAQLEGVRVVSMPCAELFMTQDAAYREAVLPASIRARVAVEAAHVDYWWKFVGLDGKVIGMTTYGESAPAKDLFQHFGITSQAVIEAVQSY